jgi:hypothetical protein
MVLVLIPRSAIKVMLHTGALQKRGLSCIWRPLFNGASAHTKAYYQGDVTYRGASEKGPFYVYGDPFSMVLVLIRRSAIKLMLHIGAL